MHISPTYPCFQVLASRNTKTRPCSSSFPSPICIWTSCAIENFARPRCYHADLHALYWCWQRTPSSMASSTGKGMSFSRLLERCCRRWLHTLPGWILVPRLGMGWDGGTAVNLEFWFISLRHCSLCLLYLCLIRWLFIIVLSYNAHHLQQMERDWIGTGRFHRSSVTLNTGTFIIWTRKSHHIIQYARRSPSPAQCQPDYMPRKKS